MKTILLAATAAFFATAATAQSTPGTTGTTSPPSGMSQPGSPDSTGTAPTGSSSSGTYGNSTTGDAMQSGSANSTGDVMLTQRNGNWYNGDRRATSEEIAQYKKNKKNRPS